MGVDVDKRNAQRRARYAADAAHRATVREAQRRRYAEDEEHCERMKARSRRQAAENPPREAKRRWARDVGTPRWRAQRQSDPRARARHRDATAARRARVRGAFVERVYRSVVWRRDEGVCGICGKPADPLDFHVDHVVPLALGGAHSYANVQVAHPFCNRSKGARAGWA